MCKLVAYYRVSTTKQGERGLGMDAQKSAAEYAARIGKPIIAEFTEVESGKRLDPHRNQGLTTSNRRSPMRPQPL